MPWLLPTRGRPLLCKEAVEAIIETRATQPVVLDIYAETPDDEWAYMTALPKRLPTNISYVFSRRCMAESMEWFREQHPHAPYYGWLSDDLRPRTRGWDTVLPFAAKLWKLADCMDDHISVREKSAQPICGAHCYGGELVRTMGWWALPGVKQAGIDDAWTFLLQRVQQLFGLALRVRCDQFLVEHVTWHLGRRPKDQSDSHVWIAEDMKVSKVWQTLDAMSEARRLYAAYKAAHPNS